LDKITFFKYESHDKRQGLAAKNALLDWCSYAAGEESSVVWEEVIVEVSGLIWVVERSIVVLIWPKSIRQVGGYDMLYLRT
jgi:hypothetical protein